MSQLVSEWGWDEARLAMLDNRANWEDRSGAWRRTTSCSTR
ncbi:hypothetical protein ACLK19_25625 [Escherichia coli]